MSEDEIFPDDPWRRVLAYQVINLLGERVQYFDIPGVVNEIVDRLGFVDVPTEIDPDVLVHIMENHRQSL